MDTHKCLYAYMHRLKDTYTHSYVCVFRQTIQHILRNMMKSVSPNNLKMNVIVCFVYKPLKRTFKW